MIIRLLLEFHQRIEQDKKMKDNTMEERDCILRDNIATLKIYELKDTATLVGKLASLERKVIEDELIINQRINIANNFCIAIISSFITIALSTFVKGDSIRYELLGIVFVIVIGLAIVLIINENNKKKKFVEIGKNNSKKIMIEYILKDREKNSPRKISKYRHK